MVPPPETVALARRGYAERWTIARIKAETGIRDSATLYACFDGLHDDGSGTRPKPLPRRRIVLRRMRATRRRSRTSLTLRLWRAAEGQVREIEERLTIAHQEPTERERDARVLSVLVKTLRELAAFDADQGEANTDVNAADDDFPRDVDELRRELARKIANLRSDAAAAVPCEPAAPGGP